MVDEVQDLPHLAKGVSFRFCDLRQVFTSYNKDLKKPVVKQLSVKN
jgi:hypothetical protein